MQKSRAPAQAAERQPIEQDEGRAEHSQLVTTAHRPDEAGPEQQHKGEPAVVGDAPHLDGRAGGRAASTHRPALLPQPLQAQSSSTKVGQLG
ncbi:hypothetical protein MC885_003241 [Smutsia gigantea]|nr:hypothetical protein MC885_003241 [Smutsia gigantea]